MTRVFIIAEAGVNHNGDMGMARRLVEVAVEAGADAVKFQTFKASKVVIKSARKAEYQERATSAAESQLEMLQRLELKPEVHHELKAQCDRAGIQFLSTAFDDDSLEVLRTLALDVFKVPSGEITNLPFLRRIGSLGKRVILSTGMATLGEIEVALDVLAKAGTPKANVAVLHATTEYPAPIAEVNLRAMLAIAGAFGVTVGYSDHTRGIEIAIAAVAMGARVIEKHFTLDRDLPGPDHKASLQPDELKAMVAAIRNVELALGDGIKRPSPSEIKNMAIARRSLVASRAIRKGEIFSEANVTAKRPGTGISPMRWDEILGRPAPADFAEDEFLWL